MMKRSSAPNAIEEFKRLIVAHHNKLIIMDYTNRIQFLLNQIAGDPGCFGMNDIPHPLRFEDLPEDFRDEIAHCCMRLGLDAELDPEEDDQAGLEPVLEEEDADDEMNAPDD